MRAEDDPAGAPCWPGAARAGLVAWVKMGGRFFLFLFFFLRGGGVIFLGEL